MEDKLIYNIDGMLQELHRAKLNCGKLTFMKYVKWGILLPPTRKTVIKSKRKFYYKEDVLKNIDRMKDFRKNGMKNFV